MFNLKNSIIGMLTATVAVCAFGSTGNAQVINPNTIGAALVVPWETDPQTASKLTIATVTNTLTNQAITLHVTVLDEFWNSTNFDCPLTPSETTSFEFSYEVFNQNFGTSKLKVECSNPGVVFPNPAQTNNEVNIALGSNRGIMFVSVECQANIAGCPGGTGGLRTQGIDALIGDATIIDLGQGYAYSVSAIHIQAGAGANDGDRRYTFDGLEYNQFPAALGTNFVSPSFDGISANLILFTLDGKTNDGVPIEFSLTGEAYDDDENPISGGQKFDCYANTPLEEVFNSFNIYRELSGSTVGHVELAVTQVSNQVDSNEQSAPTGNGNGSRRRPVHGWIVQHFANGADSGNANVPVMNGAGAFARTLNQVTLPMVPMPGDTPAFSAAGN